MQSSGVRVQSTYNEIYQVRRSSSEGISSQSGSEKLMTEVRFGKMMAEVRFATQIRKMWVRKSDFGKCGFARTVARLKSIVYTSLNI